jgi:hypothetical protein
MTSPHAPDKITKVTGTTGNPAGSAVLATVDAEADGLATPVDSVLAGVVDDDDDAEAFLAVGFFVFDADAADEDTPFFDDSDAPRAVELTGVDEEDASCVIAIARVGSTTDAPDASMPLVGDAPRPSVAMYGATW